MKRTTHYLAIALAICFALPFSLQAQDRPNILILIADDMGTDAMGVYGIGTDQPNTPNLDALLSEGILFNNAWAYPTCAPSRAALITGRYGNKNGITRSGPNMSSDEVTIFEHIDELTDGEYANAVFGKWHLGNANHPNQNGIDYYSGNLFAGVDDYFNWERTTNGVTDMSDTYVTTYITDEAINWVDQQTEPWFLWMAYNAPHGPIHLPPDSLYTRTATASNFDQYMCMIESVDHEVGRLYNSLSQEEKENTFIFFMGDNGTPNSRLQGYPNMHGKSSLYEGGIRVPMFVTGFGVERVGEEEDALIHCADVFATLTELLGTDLPGGIDNSFSFHALLSDATAASRPYNYSEITNGGVLDRAIRNEQYKLIIKADGNQEFYDLLADPLEEIDLLPGPGNLTASQMMTLDELQAEADSVFLSWSCHDDIRNGDEADIDCGGSACTACVTSTTAFGLPNTITLYPNPATNTLRLELTAEVIQEIRVYDTSGRLLIERNQVGVPRKELDISSLPAGSYFLEIRTPNRVSRQSFIKLSEK